NPFTISAAKPRPPGPPMDAPSSMARSRKRAGVHDRSREGACRRGPHGAQAEQERARTPDRLLPCTRGHRLASVAVRARRRRRRLSRSPRLLARHREVSSLVAWRVPTLRTRPACLSRSIGRFNSRAVAPTVGAITVIISPGIRHTASYTRSLSVPISSAARRAPPRERAGVVVVLGRDGFALGVAAVANARSTAARAAARVAEMYSSTRCSMRLQNFCGFVVFVMRDEFARSAFPPQPLPLTDTSAAMKRTRSSTTQVSLHGIEGPCPTAARQDSECHPGPRSKLLPVYPVRTCRACHPRAG